MNNLDTIKSKYKDKKVLILGLGVNQGGVGSAKFFANAQSRVRVTDLKSKAELQDSLEQLKSFPEIEYTLGEHKESDIDWADLVIRNPAIKPNNKYLQYALNQGKQVEMDLGIFLQFISPEQVIGVTGTKGKSTTSTLIYEALKDEINVLLAGNIGKSMLDCIPQVTDDKTFVVLELSSFHLQALETHKVSPKWSVITNIYPDHLNYHESMEEYIWTKRKIGEYQKESDYLFLNKNDKDTHTPNFLKGLKGKIKDFSAQDLPATFNPKLPGLHNKDNIACALAVARTFDLDTEKVLAKLKDFEGVEFRMQLISDKGGIKIYNDTTATMPQAAIESIKSLPNSIVIAGGMNKGLSYIEMAKSLDEFAKQVYFLEGDATDELKLHMMGQEKIMGTYNTLQDLLKDAVAEAKSGDIILFTPGATSFNLFQNEFDRGRQFNQVVKNLLSNA